jgi:hypothetical protein
MTAPRRPIKPGPGKRMVDGKDFRLADDVRHIQRCAARHDGRIVTVGQLILFSTQTGDAWPGCSIGSGIAAPLARDGDPEPIHIEETDANFTIEWRGTTVSRVRHSCSSIGRPVECEPSSVTQRRSWNTSGEIAEISNMFG